MLKRILTISYIFFIIWIVLCANFDWPNPILQSVKKIMFYDKIGHILLLGLLTFMVNWMFNWKTLPILKKKWLGASVIIFIIATIDEFSQLFINTRSFDLIDLMFNYLGIVIISIAYFQYKKIKLEILFLMRQLTLFQ